MNIYTLQVWLVVPHAGLNFIERVDWCELPCAFTSPAYFSLFTIVAPVSLYIYPRVSRILGNELANISAPSLSALRFSERLNDSLIPFCGLYFI